MVTTHAQQLVSYLLMVSVVPVSATWCPDAELENITSDKRFSYAVTSVSDGLIVLGGNFHEGDLTGIWAGLWFFDTKGHQLTKNMFDDSRACFMKWTVAVDADTVVTSCGEAINIFSRSGDLLGITRPDPEHDDVRITHVAMDDTVLVAAAEGSLPSFYVFDKTSDDQQFVRFEVEMEGIEYSSVSLRSIVVDNWKLVVSAGTSSWAKPQDIVHVYDMSGHRLVALARAVKENFGRSLAIDNGKIVVGAPNYNLNNGGTGHVYVFDTTGNELSHFTEPSHSQSERGFGSSVDIDDGMIVVGSSCCAYAYDAATGRKLFFRDLDDIANGISDCETKTTNNIFSRVAVDRGVIVAGVYIFDTRAHQHEQQIHNNQFLNLTLV